MLRSAALLPSSLAVHKPKIPGRCPQVFGQKASISVVSAAVDPYARPLIPKASARDSTFLNKQFSSIAPPTMQLGRNLGLRPTPELGLLSLLFVLSTATGAFFSLAIISLPTMHALRRLAISADELSKVVLEEVPGTLLSFKLSGLEITDLTQQLSNLRSSRLYTLVASSKILKRCCWIFAKPCVAHRSDLKERVSRQGTTLA